MNLALVDPFVLTQDYPDTSTGYLRSGHICNLRFNRKGDLLAAGRADGVITIFDMDTEGVAGKLKGHTRQIQSLSWSRTGRFLLSSSQDMKAIIWDLQDNSQLRTIRFEAPVYIADLNPANHLMFAVALYEDQPLLVDATLPITVKYHLPSSPMRSIDEQSKLTEKQIAADQKFATTITIFDASGEYIIAGTNKGFINIIEVATRTTIYSIKVCTGVIIFLRLANNGKDVVVNCSDKIIRTIPLPDLSADPDTISLHVEHKFQDMVNKLSWNHAAFSATGEYVTATTYNNHDIYIWERDHGSLAKILETPAEHGVVEWHPHKAMIAACGIESGRVNIWGVIPQQRWSALAPDFLEVEENVDYVERENEFDIHPQEEIHKRRLDQEDEYVDCFTAEPTEEEESFVMPVHYDFEDSEGEEEFVTIGRGEMRRRSPTEGKDFTISDAMASTNDVSARPTTTNTRNRRG